MGCGCNGGKRVQYEVRKPDGSKQVVQTTQEALSVIRASGGGTYKAVAAK